MKANNLYKILMLRISAEAEKLGLRPSEMAAVSEMSEARITAIFSGQAEQISLRELAGLSRALGVPVTAMLTPL